MEELKKRGRFRCSTAAFIYIAISAFILSVPFAFSDIVEYRTKCTNGELPCGSMMVESGREFLCAMSETQARIFGDSEALKGEVLSCMAPYHSEFAAAPASSPAGNGMYWVFCGKTEPNAVVSFTAHVQKAYFQLSPNVKTERKPCDVGTEGCLDIPMDFIVSANSPNQAITGVGVKFGTTRLAGLGIYVRELRADGTLGDEIQIFNGVTDESQFNITIKAPSNEYVATGIKMAFRAPSGNLASQNLLSVDFRKLQPSNAHNTAGKNLLSDTVLTLSNNPYITAQYDFDYRSFRDRVLTSVGVTTWNAAGLGENPAIPAGFTYTIQAMQASYRILNSNLQTVILENVQKTLSDSYEDAGGDGFEASPERWHYLTLLQGGSVELSFLPNTNMTAMKAPSGRIYAKVPFFRSTAQKTFGIVPDKQLQRQPLIIEDDAERLRRYMCFSDNKNDYNIVYCADSSSGTATTGTESIHQAAAGDSFEGDSGFGAGLQSTRYYCLKNGEWATNAPPEDIDDIDTKYNDPEGEACTNARDYASMGRLGYLWTGTKCCGDDIGEYYNDNGANANNPGLTIRKGGCWNENGYSHMQFVPTKNSQSRDVIVFNGTFEGCRIDAGAYNSDNNNLLNIKDSDGNTLINNTDYCTYIKDRDNKYFCSYKEEWAAGGEEAALTLRSIRWPLQAGGESEKECCSGDKCWDGNGCIAHGTQKGQAQNEPTHYCYHGEWKTENEDIFKYTPDKGARSLNCQQSQCYSGEDEGCVNNGLFKGDNICANGEWSTRTRMAAEEMLKAAGDDFTLYCDTYDKVLNYFKYNYIESKNLRFSQGDIESEYLNADSLPAECGGKTAKMINNICVLAKGNKEIMFGVSLNCDVDAPHHNILKLFGKDASHCKRYQDSPASYKLCTQAKPGYKQGYAYYNPSTNTLIFSPNFNPSLAGNIQQCSINPSYSFLDLFNSYNYICWGQMLANTFSNPNQEETLRSYINEVKNIRGFNKIYLAKKEDKTVFGAMEAGLVSAGGETVSYLGLYYDGFYADMCGLVEKIAGSSNYKCSKKGSTFEIVSADTAIGGLFSDESWNKLTASTRVKKITATRCYPDGCNGNIPALCGTMATEPSDPDYGAGENDCCGQGQTASNDPDCSNDMAGEIFNCNDNVDNDQDGAKDKCDSDCGIVSDNVANSAATEIICDDSIDNDCDGSIDLSDSDCVHIHLNPLTATFAKGMTSLFTVTPEYAGNYNWEIIANNPITAGNNVCEYESGSIYTSQANTISLKGLYPGICRIKARDPRGMTAESREINVEAPKIMCEFSQGNCPQGSTSVMKLSARTNGLAGLPSSSYSNNICCRLSSMGNLQATGGLFLYSLLADGKASAQPSTAPGSTNVYISGDEQLRCGSIATSFLGVSALALETPSSSDVPFINQPEMQITGSCQSAGYDTCVAALSQESNAFVSDCSTAGASVNICCRVYGYGGGAQGECGTEGEKKCSQDALKIQVCHNGRWYDDTQCNFLCVSGVCLIS